MDPCLRDTKISSPTQRYFQLVSCLQVNGRCHRILAVYWKPLPWLHCVFVTRGELTVFLCFIFPDLRPLHANVLITRYGNSVQWVLSIALIKPVLSVWLLRAMAFSIIDNLTTHLSDFRIMITFYKLFMIPRDSKFPAESFTCPTSLLSRRCREFPCTPSRAGTIAPNGIGVIINNPIS